MKKLLLLLTLFVSFNCIGQLITTTTAGKLPPYMTTLLATDVRKDTLGVMPIIDGKPLTLFTYPKETLAFYYDRPIEDIKIVSKYDTTVLYGGFISFNHTHDYARKNNRQISNISCAVYHGLSGCPDTWEDFNLICTSGCYRHLNVKEKRYTEVVKSEYEIALEKLHNLLKNNK